MCHTTTNDGEVLYPGDEGYIEGIDSQASVDRGYWVFTAFEEWKEEREEIKTGKEVKSPEEICESMKENIENINNVLGKLFGDLKHKESEHDRVHSSALDALDSMFGS